MCLGKQVEKFGESYPQPADKLKAWHAFVKINPDKVTQTMNAFIKIICLKLKCYQLSF